MKRFHLAAIPALALLFTAFITTTETADHHRGASENIVELAVGNENLSTLVAAVQAADFVELLSSEGPFTVFAPTNEAFEALPDGTLEMLLMPENIEMLQSILALHVVPGKVMSGDLSDGMSAESANGKDLTFSIGYGGASVNGSDIIMTDIEASNGVVHVIDTVILPETAASSY
ncbi:MAG: fasciclin domain-containing protein [Bacteroidetes bacterium]|nr:fasciclin domain-containing protein [Bacteroidota bacterium]